MSSPWRRLGRKVNWWLGLAGNVSLVYAVLFGGSAAIALTTVTGYAVSFLSFVSTMPLFFRLLFYASVLILSFALVNHGAQWLRDWWARRGAAVATVSPETEAQERWRQQDALDRYLNEMQRWVLDKNEPLVSLSYQDPRRKMARTRTETILQQLDDPNLKRNVLRFLYKHGLVSEESPVIDLRSADLSGANLSDMDLPGIHLSGANLSGADMSRTMFCNFHGHSASISKSISRGGGWEDLAQPWKTSDLSQANLSGTILKRTVLTGCNLIDADFAGADLDGTDVRGGTDLRLARNLTREQIKRAYGSSGNQEYMPDTLLPDHLNPPEAWKKLLVQQRREREQSQPGGNEL